MRKETIDYVPKGKNRGWLICRNLSFLWAAIVAALYFYSLDTQSEDAIPAFLIMLFVPIAPLMAIGLAVRN